MEACGQALDREVGNLPDQRQRPGRVFPAQRFEVGEGQAIEFTGGFGNHGCRAAPGTEPSHFTDDGRRGQSQRFLRQVDPKLSLTQDEQRLGRVVDRNHGVALGDADCSQARGINRQRATVQRRESVGVNLRLPARQHQRGNLAVACAPEVQTVQRAGVGVGVVRGQVEQQVSGALRQIAAGDALRHPFGGKGLQRRAQIVGAGDAAQVPGQPRCVFERDIDPLPHERRGRVGSIAEDNGEATVIPATAANDGDRDQPVGVQLDSRVGEGIDDIRQRPAEVGLRLSAVPERVQLAVAHDQRGAVALIPRREGNHEELAAWPDVDRIGGKGGRRRAFWTCLRLHLEFGVAPG